MTRVELQLPAGPIVVPDAVWEERDVMLYALGVGAGQDDPTGELQLTTENSEGHALTVLPTFGMIICEQLVEQVLRTGPLDAVLHAEQELQLTGPIPSVGRARLSGAITSVYDKGRGALVTLEGAAHDLRSGELLLRTRSSMYVRGAGGFGGERGPPATGPAIPDREPDHQLSFTIPAAQALLYRLSGDRNPLHCDPVAARRAGFARPILHGLCTYGYAGRIVLERVCDADPARMRSISTRFSAPVTPGDTLTLRAWQEPRRVLFQVLGADRQPVLDRGIVTLDG